MERWKFCNGQISGSELVIVETSDVIRTRKLEIYGPEVWVIDGGGGEAGPKDIALTEACKQFYKSVVSRKATYLDRVKSMYRLIEKYKELNNGNGDTFVRDAFCPWIEEAGLCLGISAHHIWEEVMEVK